MTIAKEIAQDKNLKEEVLNGSTPLGFEGVTEFEKGPYFEEIISYFNPFLDGAFTFYFNQ